MGTLKHPLPQLLLCLDVFAYIFIWVVPLVDVGLKNKEVYSEDFLRFMVSS